MTNQDNESIYSSRQFQDYFRNSVQSFICRADSPIFTIIAVSDSAEDMVGMPRRLLLGKSLFDVFPVFPGTDNEKPGKNTVLSSLQQAINTKISTEVPVFRYNASMLPGSEMQSPGWQQKNEPVFDEAGNVAFLIITFLNVTDQYRLPNLINELKVSEERYRSVIEQSPIAQQVFRGDLMKLELVNAAMLQFLGKGAEIIGKPLFEAVPEIIGQPIVEHLYHVYQTGEPLDLRDEKVMLHRNGKTETGYYNVSYRALYKGSQITGVLGIAIDVTEQVIVRKALTESEERFRSLLENSPGAMLVFRGEDLVFELVNDAMLQILDKDEKIIGKPLLEVLPELTGQPIVDIIREVYRTGIPYTTDGIEIDLHREGKLETGYFNGTYRPLYEDGKVTGILQAAVEVTGLFKAHQAVRESEERFRIMAEGTNIFIAVADETGNATYFNQPWTKLTGRSMQELLKFGWLDLIHPEDRDGYLKIYLDAFQVRRPFTGEFRIRNKQDEYRWLLSEGTARENNDGSFAGYISASVDITRQKQQQLEAELASQELAAINEELQQTQEHIVLYNAQLLESEEKLQMAVDTARMGTWNIDIKTLKITMSPFVKNLLGISPDQEPTMEIVMQAIDQDYHETLKQALRNALHHKLSSDTEYPIHNLITSERHWVRATGKVLTGSNGEPTDYTGIFMDITEQKQDEQRKNDFITMVSHELKTPLTSMKAYVQVLHSKAKKHEDSVASVLLAKANIQVSKMTSMINGFLNVSRLESGKILIDRQLFDMAHLIQETEEESIASVSSHKIVFAPVSETFVYADRDKIGQVVNNLISNAVKYSPSGSVINVACITREEKAWISIKDEGMGISEQDLPKLFERYYRVKEAENRRIAGFGIGLYLCSEIIKRHDGNIWAESELDKGSIFHFTLPVHADQSKIAGTAEIPQLHSQDII